MTDIRHTDTGPAAFPPGRMTETEFRALYERLRRQVPWGPDNQRGALNYITQPEVLAALAEPRLGRTVSLAAPVEHWPAADNPDPAQHEMKGPLGADTRPVLWFQHGPDRDEHPRQRRQPRRCLVPRDLRQDLVQRAVRGHRHRERGRRAVHRRRGRRHRRPRGASRRAPVARSAVAGARRPRDPEDMLAAEQDAGVRIGQGNIVFVRVGHRRRRTEQGPSTGAASRVGLHPTLLPVLAERQIAALGSDGNNDTAPSAAAGVDFPVHVLAVNALGLHLLDYLQVTGLAQACAAARRWSFLCVIAPLRLPTGTGSPVNPIAIL